MNVKYNTVVLERTAATSYFSVNDRLAFMQDIVDKISELSGVSLEVYAQTAASTSRAVAYYVVKDALSGNAVLRMYMNNTNQTIPACGTICIAPVSNTSASAYAYTTYYSTYAAKDAATKMILYMHYLKAGDLFVFGFAAGSKSAGYYGWMNMALAPVRSFSNPDEIVGYAFAQINHAAEDSHYSSIRCSQFYDPNKEDSIEYSVEADHVLHRYLTSYHSKVVALIPLMMNSFDYYLDGVYLCNKYGTPVTETAIKTDDGIYLLANTYGTAHVYPTRWYANLVFDITSVAEEAL